ncbi:MAG: outer membrane beta-barrel protein [Acidobacteriota bacterium]
MALFPEHETTEPETSRPTAPLPVIPTSSRRLASLASAMAALLYAAAPAAADDDPWRLRVNANATWVGIDEDDIQTGGELGVSVSAERRFSPLLGLEFGVLYGESSSSFTPDVLQDVFIRQESEVDFTALTAALNFHVTPGRSVDLYLGPVVALFDFGDAAITDARTLTGLPTQVLSRFSDGSEELALGAQVGADIGFGTGPWSLNVSAKYFDTSYELEAFEGFEVDFEPVIVGVGFSYRF